VFHLILAGLWVFLAALFFIWPWLDLPPLRFTGAGWLCLVLALYNFIRWWASRQSRIGQAMQERSLPPRRPRDDAPLDPNFDFSNEDPRRLPPPK
jgi:hypothetical protein